MVKSEGARQRADEAVVAAFRANDGLVKGRPRLLLLSTIGARTGAARLVPLRYSRDGNRFVVVASDEGSPRHPQWYHNVIARPKVVFEVGTDRFEADSSVLSGSERRRLLDAHISLMPFFAGYERKASPRKIPVIVLEPT